MFVDWPKPRFALVFTGDLNGYIEPCGCAGLENLKGGLSRRNSLLTQLREQGWPIAAFDLGGQVRRVGVVQTEIKLQATVKGLIDDGLRRRRPRRRRPAHAGRDVARRRALSRIEDKTLPLTSANVAIFGFDSGATARYRVVTAGGVKIGVTAVLGDSYAQGIQNDGITILPAEQALAEVVAQIDGRAMRRPRAARLRQARRDGGVGEEVSAVSIRRHGRRRRRAARESEGRRRGTGRLGRSRPQGAVRRGRRLLRRSEARRSVINACRSTLAFPNRRRCINCSPSTRISSASRASRIWASRNDLHPRADAANPLAAKFVGSEACAKCHADAFAVWKDSGHAHATTTLMDLEAAAALRSRVPELPRHRLGSAAVRAVSIGLSRPRCERHVDRHRQRLRELPRSRRRARRGRSGQRRRATIATSQPHASRQGQRRANDLHQVPRSRQQPGLQVRRVLVDDRALIRTRTIGTAISPPLISAIASSGMLKFAETFCTSS